MSLLREIQEMAVDSKVRVADLLIRCKILAVRLGNNEFREWVDRELEGYQSKENLPAYRILRVNSYGNFSGPFGLSLENALIPPTTIPKEYREVVHMAYIFDSVSSLEETLKNIDGGNLSMVWPPDLISHFGGNIYKDMNCLSAWRSISRGAVAGILDTVRNRVLNFSLAIEKVAPDAGEGFDKDKAISNEKVSQVFQTHVYGNVGNIAQASSDFTQTSLEIKQGDFNILREHLLNAGLEEKDILELRKAMESDNKGKPRGIGKNVTNWIGNMIGKASTGVWQIGTTVAAQFLTSAISQYLGLPK